MITGHRGAASLAPENTLVSIEQAAKSGATWVEIDTQLSADNIPRHYSRQNGKPLHRRRR